MTASGTPQLKTFIHRDYNFSDNDKVTQTLQLKLSDLTEEECVSTYYSDLSNILKDSMNECFPYKTTRIKRKKLENPWMTEELRTLINQKNKLYSKFVKSPITYGDEYKSIRNRVSHLIRDRKKQFYTEKFEGVKGDSKGTWKILSQMLNNQKETNIKELEVDGNIISDPQLICNTINSYFVNIGKSIEDSCGISDTHFSHYLQGEHPNFHLSEVSVDEVSRVIKSMRISGPGTDDISMKILKDGVDIVAPTFINMSFRTGNYPDELKLAKITPVFKGGDKTKMENYRQISILNAVNKIVEKIVYSKLLKHAKDNNIFTPQQFGFLNSVSTHDALLNFLSSIHSNLTENKYTVAIFLDLAKAFDSLNHNILLEKLKFYGVRGSAYIWVKNYLTNRKQCTVINNVKSSFIEITHGVPQGSVLGPLFFLFFINDFPKCSDLFKLTIFADDTNALISDNCIFRLRELTMTELSCVSRWLLANRIKANHSKTHFLILSPW